MSSLMFCEPSQHPAMKSTSQNRSKHGKLARWCAACVFFLTFCSMVGAQTLGSALSGAINDPAGKPITGASVSLQNLATGRSSLAQSGALGNYSFANVSPGQYKISVSAGGFAAQSQNIAVTSGAAQVLNFKLLPELSLSSLGFGATQTQGNRREQALLNKRSHMLQIHQRLGLITAFPLTATVVSGFFAGGRHSTNPVPRDVHIGLGSATAGLYFATAYYAIAAPKVAGVQARGPIRFHKAMAWIHGPGMILTPLAGAMAASQLNQGERLHGLARYHGDIAVVTAVAYGLALVSETKPNWIPGLGHEVAGFFSFHHHAMETASELTPSSEANETKAVARSEDSDASW